MMKQINYVLTILSFFITSFFNYYTNGLHFSGVSVIPIVIIIIFPMCNLFDYKKSIVKNKFYNIVLFLTNIVILSLYTYTMYMLFINKSSRYEYLLNEYLFIILLLQAILLITFFIIRKRNEENIVKHKQIILLIIYCTLLSCTNDYSLIGTIINFSLTILYFIILLKYDELMMHNKLDVKKIYIISIIFEIVCIHPIPIILLYSLYKNSDFNDKSILDIKY